MIMTGEQTRITERTLLDALAGKFAAPAYAMLEHVPNSTGRVDRTIDAVTMGLWGSRGHDFDGYEIKVSRSDWLRELKRPEKADGWRFDHFWLVTPLDLVKIEEVPTAWGLLEYRPTSGRFAITKPAPALNPKPITRHMLAAIMRKVHKAAIDQDERQRQYASGIDEGARRAVQAHTWERQRYENELADLRARLKAFEDASGITIDSYTGGRDLGERARLAQQLGAVGLVNMIERHRREYLHIVETMNRAIAYLEQTHGQPAAADEAHEGNQANRNDGNVEGRRSQAQ
jgi:hypothetical protein